MRCRLVRNIPMEKWVLGRPDNFAPLYDVEVIDTDGKSALSVIASGHGAEECRAIIKRVGGEEI